MLRGFSFDVQVSSQGGGEQSWHVRMKVGFPLFICISRFFLGQRLQVP